jgi:hypothetical protein
VTNFEARICIEKSEQDEHTHEETVSLEAKEKLDARNMCESLFHRLLYEVTVGSKVSVLLFQGDKIIVEFQAKRYPQGNNSSSFQRQ